MGVQTNLTAGSYCCPRCGRSFELEIDLQFHLEFSFW
jgi:hypothetical protein